MKTISTVYIKAQTTDENKECGAFRVIVKQGSNEILNDAWGSGQDWDNGHVFEQTETPGVAAIGEAIEVLVRLEELPGEVNIDWHANVRIEVRDSDGRKAIFEQYCDFDTDVNKPYHEYNLGSKHLS